MVQPTHNSISAQTVGYHLVEDNQRLSPQHHYLQSTDSFRRTVSWDPGKTGILDSVDRFDIKLQELHHAENLRLVGLEFLCFHVQETKEPFISSYMNQQTTLITSYKANQLVLNGKEELQSKGFPPMNMADSPFRYGS